MRHRRRVVVRSASMIAMILTVAGSVYFLFRTDCKVVDTSFCDWEAFQKWFGEKFNPNSEADTIILIVSILTVMHIAHDNIEIFKKLGRFVSKIIPSLAPIFDEDTPHPQNNHRREHLDERKYYVQEKLEKTGHLSFIPLNYIFLNDTSTRKPRTTDVAELYRYYGKRLVVTGTPGSGKTRVLEAIYLDLINNYAPGKSLPLWIDLKQPDNAIDARALFMEHCQRIELNMGFDGLMANNPPVIFLDGLDEIPVRSRRKRIRSLAKWFEEHPDMKVVISCRVRDYKDDNYIKKFCDSMIVLEIKPFARKQIGKYLAAHVKATEHHGRTRLRKEVAKNLYNIIKNDDALFELAKTPLHLYMLTQLSIWENSAEELPKTLSDLYDDYYEHVFNHMKKSRHRTIHSADADSLRERMTKLAAYMLSESNRDGEVNVLSEDAIRNLIGKHSLQDAQNMNLLVTSQGESSRVQFFHPMIHAYFVLPEIQRIVEQQSRKSTFYRSIRRIFRQEEEVTDLIREIGELGNLAGRAAAETLTTKLQQSGNSEQMDTVTVNALKDIGIKAIKPVLKLLSSDKEQMRIYAQDILIDIGEPVIGALLVYADKKNSAVIYRHVEIILDEIYEHTPHTSEAYIRIGHIVEAVKKRGNSEYDKREYRIYIASYLGELTSSLAIQALGSVVDELISMLNDRGSYELRGEAAYALGKLESDDNLIVAALIRGLKREEELFARKNMMEALQQKGELAMREFIMAYRHASDEERNRLEMAHQIIDDDNTRRTRLMTVVTAKQVRMGYVHKAAKYYTTQTTEVVKVKKAGV
ncbi:MAG: NACHT domain-containing protein [Aggregatilineales bacterium]